MIIPQKTFDNLGDGEIISINPNKRLFKLSSFHSNPIIKPQDFGLKGDKQDDWWPGAVFNPGAEVFNNGIVLTPRCHKNYKKVIFFDKKMGTERTGFENYISEILPLFSNDGIHFKQIDHISIQGNGINNKDFRYGIEDIRIIKLKDKYLLVGCGKVKPPFKGRNADRVAIYSTHDFKNIEYYGIITAFDSRNAIVFPETIEGKIYMLFRFHPNIHLDFLKAGFDQLFNPKNYKTEWKEIYQRKEKNILIKAGRTLHSKEKVGPGTQLIKTPEGWLLIYHSVGTIERNILLAYGIDSELKRAYSISAALLDLKNPKKIIAKSKYPIYIPHKPYELNGNKEYPIDVANVVFPTGALVINGKLLIYAGAGDKYVILLSCKLKKLTNLLLDRKI